MHRQHSERQEVAKQERTNGASRNIIAYYIINIATEKNGS